MKNRRCYCGRQLYSDKRSTADYHPCHEICDAYGSPYSFVNEIDNEWFYRNNRNTRKQYTNRVSTKSPPVDYSISLYQFISDSLANSSVNGINNCLSTKNILGKFIWLVVFSLCAAGFGYQTTKFYFLYRSKPSVVQIEVENDGEVDFPAVTVCNTNRIRKSAFCEHFPERCEAGVNALTEYEINEMLYKLLLEGKDDIKRELGHNESMVASCEYVGTPNLNGPECMDIWKYFYDPDYGNCYTFTAIAKTDRPLQARKADFWQEENQLILTLDLQIEDVMEVKRSPGVVIVVHDYQNQPDIHTEGKQLIPGLLYSVPVSKSTVILLPLPFKTNCSNYLTLPWKDMHGHKLTSRTCTVGCSQYFQLKNCDYVSKNMSLFYTKLPYDTEDPKKAKLKCADKEEEKSIDYCRSICGLPCRDSVFAATVEAARLSGKEKEIEEIMKHRILSPKIRVRDTLVQVKIFYSTMEHKIFRHVPKYDTMELFSYLGGYSGVWLGYSLLTVYELFEIAVSTVLFFFHKQIRKIQHKRVVGTVMNSRKNTRIYKKKRILR